MNTKTDGFSRLAFAAALAAALWLPATAHAQSRTVAVDCAGELKTFCSKVRPGGNRLVACLIAFEDKVSPRCRLTAYLASGTLGDRMKQLQSMAKICSSDILQYCSKVPPGGGRIFDCLKKNKATLTDECRKGMPRFELLLKH
jgi:hypothetical protein